MHSLCSYFAMFPPQVPHVFIRWLTEPGDVVYDPFSGRGTAPMEACRLGRHGMGSDANPLAHILTSAKVDPPSLREASTRLRELRCACLPGRPSDAPDDIRMLYAPEVLGQLLWLREELSVRRRTDRFLMATLLGLMHANYKPGSPARGLSISMPNTFSMSPAYVRGYSAVCPGATRGILYPVWYSVCKAVTGRVMVAFMAKARRWSTTLSPDAAVRELRELSGLTGAELAERLGIAQPNVAKAEGRGANVTLELLWRFAEACGLKLELVLSGDFEEDGGAGS